MSEAKLGGRFTFPGTSLTVHRMGYGAMQLSGPGIWGPPKDRAEAHRVLRRAVALGVNFFDTADSYGPEVDETLIAEALYPYPAGFVIGTKGGLVRPTPTEFVGCRCDRDRARGRRYARRSRMKSKVASLTACSSRTFITSSGAKMPSRRLAVSPGK